MKQQTKQDSAKFKQKAQDNRSSMPDSKNSKNSPRQNAIDKCQDIIVSQTSDFLTTIGSNTKKLEVSIIESLKPRLLKEKAGISNGTIVKINGLIFDDEELCSLVEEIVYRNLPLAVQIGTGRNATLIEVSQQHLKRKSLLSSINIPGIKKTILENKLLPMLKYYNDQCLPSAKYSRALSPSDFPANSEMTEAIAAYSDFSNYLESRHPDQFLTFKLVLKHFLFARRDRNLQLLCMVLFGPNGGGKGTMLRLVEAIPWCRRPIQFSFAHASAEYTTGNVFTAEHTLSVCSEMSLSTQPKIFPQMMKSATRREQVTVRETSAKVQLIAPSHSFVLMANTSQQSQRHEAIAEVSRFLAPWDAYDRFHLAYIDWRTSAEGNKIGERLDRFLNEPVSGLAIAHEVFSFGLTLQNEEIRACSIEDRYKKFRQDSSAPALTVFLELFCIALLTAHERLSVPPTCDSPHETPRELKRDERNAILAECLRPICKDFTNSLEVINTAPTDPFSGYLIPSSAYAVMLKKLLNEGQKWQVPAQLQGLCDRTSVRRSDRRFVAFNIDKIRSYQEKISADDGMTKSETGPP